MICPDCNVKCKSALAIGLLAYCPQCLRVYRDA